MAIRAGLGDVGVLEGLMALLWEVEIGAKAAISACIVMA